MATDELTGWSLAAETKEWVGPVVVTADGSVVTTFQMTVTAPGVRPGAWVNPTVLDGRRGVLVGVGTTFLLLPGRKYTVWVKFSDDPEAPVTRIGTIRVY